MRLARTPTDRVASLLVIALVVLLPASFARAQGTDGTMPDPITGRELDRLSRTLNLSEQQRLAIDPMHERYLAEFAALREGQIEAFLATSRRSMMGFMTRPDAKAAKKMLDDLDRILGRIRQLDEGLFDEIQGVLTDAQAAEMPLVRRMRERTRLRAGLARAIGFVNPGANVDLVEVVEGMGLVGDAADRVDPLVPVYAERSTAMLRDLVEDATKAMIEFVERMEAVIPDLQAEAERNPREAMRAFQQVEIVLREIAAEPLERAARVAAANRREAGTFMSVLPADDARRFRTEYLRRAYPEIEKGEATMRGRFDMALARPLGAETRSQVEDLRMVTEARHESIADRLMEAYDEKRTSLPRFGFGNRGGPGANAIDARIAELDARRTEIDDEATRQLLAALGLEDVDALNATVVEIAAAPVEGPAPIARRAATRRGRTAMDRLAPAIDPPAGGDPLLPAAIDADEFAAVVERIGLEADARPVANALHEDYRGAWESLIETRVRPVVERAADRWNFDAESGELRTPAPADIDAVYAERSAVLAEMLALDDRLFSDLALLPGGATERLEIERGLRRRAALNRGEGPMMAGFRQARRFSGGDAGRREDRIDLARLVEIAVDEAGARERAAPALREYDVAATPLFRARYDALVASSRAMEMFALEMAAMGRDGGARLGDGAGLRTASEESGRRLEEAGDAIAALNRATLERLRGSLDSAGAAALDDLYRRAAHPEVYRDPESAEPALLAALELDDLTPAQSAQVGDLLLDFRARYNELCDRLLALAGGADDGGDPRAGFQRREERRLEGQRVRFERSELSDRTLRRLRSILNDAQRTVLGLDA